LPMSEETSAHERLLTAGIGAPLVVVIWLLSVILLWRWLAHDSRPLSWDAAEHAFSTISYYQLLLLHRLSLDAVFSVQFWYPPLVYLVAIPFFGLFGVHPDVAVWGSGAVFLLILFASTYSIAARIGGRVQGAIALLLIASYPIIVHDSRNFMLDIPLAAMVSLGFYLLLRTELFTSGRASVAFGIVSGLGMLTKWTYLIYLIAPVLLGLIKGLKSRDDKSRVIINTLLAGTIGLVVMSLWYAPVLLVKGQAFWGRTFQVVATNAEMEGDPQVPSVGSLAFYLKTLLRYYLWLPYFVLAVSGLIFCLLARDSRHRSLALAFIVSYAVLVLIPQKGFRYVIPMLPYCAVASSLLLGRLRGGPRTTAIAVVAAVFALHTVGLSFSLNGFPRAASLGEGAPIWSFSEEFLPDPSDYKTKAILKDARAETGEDMLLHLCVLPDVEHFEWYAFLLQAKLLDIPMYRVPTIAIVHSEDYLELLGRCQFILAKTGEQGCPWNTFRNGEVVELLESGAGPLGSFEKVESYALADGSTGDLYKNVELFKRLRELKGERPSFELNAVLGDMFELVGFSYEQSDEHITMRYFWRCLKETDGNYKVFVHFENPESGSSFQDDHYPLGGFKPTYLWRNGELIAEQSTIKTASEIEKGVYNVYIGMFDEATGKKLHVEPTRLNDGDDRIKAGEIDVE